MTSILGMKLDAILLALLFLDESLPQGQWEIRNTDCAVKV